MTRTIPSSWLSRLPAGFGAVVLCLSACVVVQAIASSDESGQTGREITNGLRVAEIKGDDTLSHVLHFVDADQQENKVAVCQNVTVELNASGTGSTMGAAVNNGSSDACGIQSLSLSQTTFNCANVGSNTVTLTVTDVNNNTATCSATVTVQDLVVPVAVCQNVTVQLDNTGNGSTTAAAVNNGSSDACGIQTLSLSQTAFTCASIATNPNTVTLTVTDVNGNQSQCTATVTVQDLVAPVAVCQPVTVQLDNTGNGSTTAAAVNNGSSDACRSQSLALSQTAVTCTNVDSKTVTLTVTDVKNPEPAFPAESGLQ